MFQRVIKGKLNLDWDQVGFWVSLLCGIHCVAMPFVLGVLPFTGKGEFTHEIVEFGVLLTSVIVGSYALFNGYLKHKNLLPTTLMLSGFTVIGIAMTIGTELSEMILMPIGALGLAVGHLKNHKLLHTVS